MSVDTVQTPKTPWWSREPDAVASELATSPQGLTGSEAASRLQKYGRNQLTAAKPASFVQLCVKQLADPMNIMLVAVAVISFAIGQASTGILVALLVAFNVFSGARQEQKAQASVDALATMQVPQVRVHRDGAVVSLPAPELVPGDVVELEAGDIVPADARILRSTTLETQEAALTGESTPIEKSATATAEDVVLGDRSSMVYQNTSVTRGTATVIVVATGMSTEMGAIATMLAQVERVRSPLQKELGSLTNVIGAVAWGAVAIIIGIGLMRNQSFADLMFLGTAVAISAIPTGMPTFVQQMLAWGANQLAQSKAIIASLNDVETLGATSAICSDKTGTLTMNEMMARSIWIGGRTFSVDGAGYSFEGAVRSADGEPVEHNQALAYALALPNDATVSADGVVIGDPTEAAFVVLAQKLGVDVPEIKRKFPRLAEVPFDSDYKFMATFHRTELQGQDRLIAIVKGAPDVLLARSTEAFVDRTTRAPVATLADKVTEEIEYRSSQGLRTLALAIRVFEDKEEKAALADPMSSMQGLVFVGVVGIVDPLRLEAKLAVEEAQAAGITVRMITGDHVVTAAAIGKELGLTGQGMAGVDFAALSDAEVDSRLDDLSVFGRVTPQDKLRLVQRLQNRGEVVAMTGDAVNDAAAIKQADIGVAMGSGSEVTKQAAKLVLTDDNFATLVHAVRLGRAVYQKIANYLTFQMGQLISLVLLFLVASIFNVNEGMALTPIQVLVLNFAVAIFAVIVIIMEPEQPGLMQRPPRNVNQGIASGKNVLRWLIYGAVLFLVSFAPLWIFSDDLAGADTPSYPVTMTYVIMAFGTLGTAIALRRDPEFGFKAPWGKAMQLQIWPVLFIVLSTELGFLQRWIGTTSLSPNEWLICILMTLVLVGVVVGDTALRHKKPAAVTPTVQQAVEPARAR
ncbi:cation-translocating P-type ATPase [Demequina sp.]|uniref:cation-translocating P-type ATPase n=1 Tax=Demequina sp. TaxID=2050685 RepID=UPI003D0D2BFA